MFLFPAYGGKESLGEIDGLSMIRCNLHHVENLSGYSGGLGHKETVDQITFLALSLKLFQRAKTDISEVGTRECPELSVFRIR